MVKKDSKMKYDMAWGNPYFLLELLHTFYGEPITVPNVRTMSYAPNEGKEELIDLTQKAIYETSEIPYRYIIITAGATQAINSILKYRHQQRGYKSVITPRFGYPFYSDMILNSGMARVMSDKPYEVKIDNVNPMYLIDSPSNPLGLQFEGSPHKAGLTVWDGVYHNKIYTNDLKTYPPHICMVGSFSKLLGLTGARVGWIATDDLFFYERIKEVSLKDIATVSIPSQDLLIDILKKINLNSFTEQGSRILDYNREEFQSIEYLFDGQPVQETGMFYCAKANKKALSLLDECGVAYVLLADDMIRLSMGQTRDITKSGIRAILRRDTI